MPPSVFLRASRKKRKAVSELYASMLMVGITLSLGGLVAATAVSQSGLSTGSSALGSSLEQRAAGLHLGLVYAAVASTGSCPGYQGYGEGTSLTVSLYNYGTTGFTPVELFVNSTARSGPFGTLSPGNVVSYALSLGSCSHSSGLTILMVDSSGEEAQFGT